MRTERRRRLASWMMLVALAVMCGLSFGCRATDPSKFPPSVAAPNGSVHAVYVTANHWHAGIVLADDDLPPRLDAALDPWRQRRAELGLAHATHHEFGWGDDAYYKAPPGTKTSGMTLAALLWPTRSVNHIWSLSSPPDVYFADWNVAVFRIDLSPAGYAALCDFILDHLTEPVTLEQPGVYREDSVFLTANPQRRYHVLHNCNHMTADALAAAGLPISALYAVHSKNVEWQLDRADAKYEAVTRLRSRNGDATD